ncbi:hypothetical protein REPUB_Repub06bG0131700 [Reevesia pubescens]
MKEAKKLKETVVGDTYEILKGMVDNVLYGIQLLHGPLDLTPIKFGLCVEPSGGVNVRNPNKQALEACKSIDRRVITISIMAQNIPDVEGVKETKVNREDEEDKEDEVPLIHRFSSKAGDGSSTQPSDGD